MDKCNRHHVAMYYTREGKACAVCESEWAMEQQARDTNALLYEQISSENARRAEQSPCEFCGKFFAAHLRKFPRPGKRWRGMLASFQEKGVCPGCYHARVEKGEELEWTKEDWSSWIDNRLRSVNTSTEATGLLSELAGSDIAELSNRVERRRKELKAAEDAATRQQEQERQAREHEEKAKRERQAKEKAEADAKAEAERERIARKEREERERLAKAEATRIRPLLVWRVVWSILAGSAIASMFYLLRNYFLGAFHSFGFQSVVNTLWISSDGLWKWAKTFGVLLNLLCFAAGGVFALFWNAIWYILALIIFWILALVAWLNGVYLLVVLAGACAYFWSLHATHDRSTLNWSKFLPQIATVCGTLFLWGIVILAGPLPTISLRRGYHIYPTLVRSNLPLSPQPPPIQPSRPTPQIRQH